MTVTRALAVTVVAGAALGLSAPLAAAASGPANPSANPSASSSAPSYGSNSTPNNIIVTPKDVKPGGTLTVTVDGSSCRGSGKTYDAIVESSVFSRTPLKGIVNQGSSVATAKIFSTAKNGAYKVTATCGGKSITGGDFTVGDTAVKGDPPKGAVHKLGTLVRGAKSGALTKGGEGSATTKGGGALTKGAKTGLGGSHGGINTIQAALGATLLAAAVTGGGVYLLRRRAGSKY
ncbi:hypothetical protein [Streptomyces silvisoli]|uniref:Uncharacterized protein n=1 Tax=Streptomyces silvisoli TaxID=3034235 RepID=A0ABT5ZJG6_9ACTN|nr:hypothetical protein [Streptomyces silvisoli]MDF3289977.1 hypothetical protein [Streptomyces silvisoli]